MKYQIEDVKRLLSCTATVEYRRYEDGVKAQALKSYDTFVAILLEDGGLYLGYDYDCSTTTMSHLRKWLALNGVSTSIPKLRQQIKEGTVKVVPTLSLWTRETPTLW